jgi:hypothetical protein
MGDFLVELRRCHIFRIGAGLVCAWMIFWVDPASAQTLHAIPDFSGLWARTGVERGSFRPPPGSFRPPPGGGPGPIMVDLRYPPRFLLHAAPPERVIRAVNAWIPDLTNPILKPQTRERLSEIAEQELAGIPYPRLETMCMPPGVPQVLNLFDNMQVLQMPNEVVFLYSRNSHVRHVYLNQVHSDAQDNSWWGDSVGHYEGDTLVIDTYGLNDKTNVDRFGTTHSDKIHVVERYRISDDGRSLDAVFTVEDHEAFTVPWSALADYVPDNRGWLETICPENAERQFWPGLPIYIPKDETPDF